MEASELRQTDMQRHLYFYTHISRPYPAVAELLAGEPGLWLPAPAEANGVGWQVLLRADGALPARLAERLAKVSTEPPTVNGRRLLRAVSWQATTKEQLFPVLHADLELDELPATGCHLSLMGTYRPPLSVVGGAGDAIIGHRVAEAVVRRFVLDVAERVESTLAAA
jgi:hypothetical protein